MPEPIVLRIAGRAATKGRPRFDSRTGRAFTPPANIISENDVRAVWREAGEPRLPDDTAIALDVLIHVARPAGHFRKGGALSAEGFRHPVPRNQKPDLDNAVKLIMDALETRAYRNDVRIARVSAERRWGEWPETLITLAPHELDARGLLTPQIDLAQSYEGSSR